MAIDIFVVIRPNPQNPPLSETQTTDSYFSSTFPGAIVFEVSEFDFGVQNLTSPGTAASGAGAGKASFGQLVIRKTVDKVSPALFNLCASGQHLVAIQLYVRHPGAAGAPPVPSLAYEFQMVFVAKIEWSGTAEDSVAEQVSFAYGAMAIAFQAANPDGSMAGAPTKTSWSQIQNSASVQDSIVLQ